MVEKYLQEMKELKEERNTLKIDSQHAEQRFHQASETLERQVAHLETENKKLKEAAREG